MSQYICAKSSLINAMHVYNNTDRNIKIGDKILVEEEQGLMLARVSVLAECVPTELAETPVRDIVRRATADDLLEEEKNNELVAAARVFCKERVQERELEMKLVDVECLFDRSKLIFYFTAPMRIDFRELVKDLVREYRTRIELRQIGVRHETQMLGAVGSCGMACCCRRFLRKFAPVTIKMAKEQNLFLNPAKISGICGRLLCCLSYEQENYDVFQNACPRLGKRYQTDLGTLKVLRANLFRNSVTVLNEQGEEQEYALEEWQELNPQRPESNSKKNDPKTHSPQKNTPHNDLMVVVADLDMLEISDELSEEDLFQKRVSVPHEQKEIHTPRNKRKKKK